MSKLPDGRETIVPVHAGQNLGRGLIRAILRDTSLSIDEYIDLR